MGANQQPKNPAALPAGASQSLWVVIRPNGDRHIIEKPLLEGIHVWARDQNVTVLQYNFATVLYEMKPEENPEEPKK